MRDDVKEAMERGRGREGERKGERESGGRRNVSTERSRFFPLFSSLLVRFAFAILSFWLLFCCCCDKNHIQEKREER